ncbi:hypothetical protein K3495_g12742 [Podosphaera aphanis]|nr:hypothetical protein K3495_g12742 [Podosphaera aphanis]
MWANSREEFLKAVRKFEYGAYSQSPERSTFTRLDAESAKKKSNRPITPSYHKETKQESIEMKPALYKRNFSITAIPREILSLFQGFDKLEEDNWTTWKGHMRDNLEICYLWDIVTGSEQRPSDLYLEDAEDWDSRERIARVLIKNSLGSRDYQQIRHAKTASEIWETLMSRHQATGAQGKVDLIWKFWSKRCDEGTSVREHIGEILGIHTELAEAGIYVEGYLLAILMGKSLPSSYDNFVSTIFAGIRDLEQADPKYMRNKIFEEEMRRQNKSEDAHVAENKSENVHVATQKRCHNCKRLGHLISECYSKGGGKEGQGPRQIARRKKEEAEQKKEEKYGHSAEIADQDSFFSSHMAYPSILKTQYNKYSFYPWSQDSWIADSGASAHIANRREMFTAFAPSEGTLNVAGGLTARIEGTGVVQMRGIVNGKVKLFKLMNVLYVPSTRFCLISGPKLDKAGGKAKYANGMCSFWDSKGELIATGVLDGNLYRLNARAILNDAQIVNAAVPKTTMLSWNEAHRRLGHISLSSLKLLFGGRMVDGIGLHRDESIPQFLNCKSCILAKAHRKAFPKCAEKYSENYGDLIHTDVWGSPNVKQTPGGNQYFILFIDDHTRHTTVKLMKDKASVKQQLMNYCSFIHTQYDRWPKEIRSDNAAEYEGTRSWLEERGIRLNPSAPHSPQQNGVSERMNRTLLELARAMIIEKQLPEFLWGEAVLHASWIRNRSPTKVLDGKTPMEALSGNRPDLSSAQEFGEDVYIFEELSRAKIQPKARKCRFTGFEEGPKAIRYYDATTRRIKVSRNYNFMLIKGNEPTKGSQSTPISSSPSDINSSENLPVISSSTNIMEPSQLEGESQLEQHELFGQNEAPKNPEIAARQLRLKTASGEATKKNYADLVRFNPRNHIRKSKQGYAAYNSIEGRASGDYYINSPPFINLVHALITENGDSGLPNTIEEARKCPDHISWEKAIQTELDMLNQKNTWELVDPPKEANIIGNRWIFTRKFDENGQLCKYKARLVAQGFTQGYIYDYSDTFSPVVRFDSFRLVLAIAAYHGLEIGQIDIKGAYLNGNLTEEIFMTQPKGCDDGTGRVCRLVHTLYGLKQSGREWNKMLKAFLVEKAKYSQLIKEHGLFFRCDSQGYDIIAVWVDDFLIASTDSMRLRNTKLEIANNWETTDLGEPKLLLGVQLERDPKTKTIKIYQEQYILKILRRFGMEDCTPVSTPLPPGATFTPSYDDEAFGDATKYRAAIGSLMFASVATRPDIAYATNLMSQFNGAPSQKHWNGVKNILRYLNGTIKTGILYDKARHHEPDFTLTAYSDADNGKGYDRKSISGSVITIVGGAVKWAAEKQRLITVSTSESEYVAANLTGRNCLFLRDIMEELGFPHNEPIPLFMDSDGAIALTKNPENMRATLHIDKIYHWIRQHVEQGTFSPESIPGRENPADIFTKSLDRSSFERHKINIGIF